MDSGSAGTAQARGQTSLSPAVMVKSACFDTQAQEEPKTPSEVLLRLINLFPLLLGYSIGFPYSSD